MNSIETDNSPTVNHDYFNSSWSRLIKWIRVITVRCQSDPVNTKESVLLVCDNNEPYHTNKIKVQKGEEIEVLRNYAH